jgi:hypothetical protein
MNIEQIKQAILNTPKGANIILEWLRPCKVKKGATLVNKAVRMVGRIGVDYNNIASVQEKRESGELPETPQPIWNGKGVWDIFPWLFHHADTGEFYLRLYKGTSKNVKPEVHYFKGGIEVPFEEISDMLLSSEKQEKEGDTFCCKIENVTRIHQESEWNNIVFGQTNQEIISVESIPAKVIATVIK